MFRWLHSRHIKNFYPLHEITIFVKLSADVFVKLEGHDGDRVWPLVFFIILNYTPSIRFMASETIITSFIAENHDSGSFDPVLEQVIINLRSLEKGIDTIFNHGVSRNLR